MSSLMSTNRLSAPIMDPNSIIIVVPCRLLRCGGWAE